MKEVCGWVCLFWCMSLCVCLCVCLCLSVSVCFCVVSDGYGMVLSHRTNFDKFGGQNSIRLRHIQDRLWDRLWSKYAHIDRGGHGGYTVSFY